MLHVSGPFTSMAFTWTMDFLCTGVTLCDSCPGASIPEKNHGPDFSPSATKLAAGAGLAFHGKAQKIKMPSDEYF